MTSQPSMTPPQPAEPTASPTSAQLLAGMELERPLGTVYVTGGSSGLGAAVVEVVTALGGTAAVIDRAAPPAGSPAAGHAVADVSDAAAVERAVADLVERVGPPTALLTAAGTDAVGRLEDVPADRWANVVGVNLIGTAAAVRACLPHLVAAPGPVARGQRRDGRPPRGDTRRGAAADVGG